MSLSALLARSRPYSPFLSRHRRYSDSHRAEQHGEQHLIEYPPEGISSTIWRNSILLVLASVGFYKLAPSPGEDVFLTRWIALYSTPVDEWARRAAKHLSLARSNAETEKLFTEAKKPAIHRYRYPQTFDAHSSHRVPVGSEPDVGDFVVKS